MDKYISTETFEMFGIIYPKVNINSNWNCIGIRQDANASTMEIYTIPEGSYSYMELYEAIADLFNEYFTDKGIDDTCNKFQLHFSTSENYMYCGYYFTKGRYDLVAVDNGLQQILPFTVPLKFVHDNSYEQTIWGQKNHKILIVGLNYETFELIWLNENFLKGNKVIIEYPKCFIGTSCNYSQDVWENPGSWGWVNTDNYGSIVPGNVGEYNRSVYINNGVYTLYGLIMAIYLSLENSDITSIGSISGSHAKLRFTVTVDDLIHIHRNEWDNKWSIINCNNCIADEISNYKIKPFNPNNWTQDGIISFEIDPNHIVCVNNNSFLYQQEGSITITDNDGLPIQTTSYNNGYCTLYDNTLEKVESLHNCEMFYADIVSVDITLIFNTPDLLVSYDVYCNFMIDSETVYAFADKIQHVSSKTYQIHIPVSNYGFNRHMISFDTNANTINYIVNQWTPC